MGRTVRYDQVFITRIDPQSVEEQTSQLLDNIKTADLEASNVLTSNIGINVLDPEHSFQMGQSLFMDDGENICLTVNEGAKFARMFVEEQFGIKTTNPNYDFEVGDADFFVDLQAGEDANTAGVDGRFRASNIYATHDLQVGSNVIIDGTGTATDALVVNGNLLATKVTASEGLSFGSNLEFNDTGSNIAVFAGNVSIGNLTKRGELVAFGNVQIFGNLHVSDNPTYVSYTNSSTTDSIIEMGVGGGADNDTALVYHQYNESNVFVGYIHGPKDELILGRTQYGPADQTIIPTSEEINVSVIGTLYSSSRLAVANANPDFNFSIGSNLWANDVGSNVLFVNGNTYSERITVGHSFNLGSNVVISDTADYVFDVTGNAQFSNLYTTDRIIIANTNPDEGHSLCIGDVLHVHADRSRFPTALMVHGNTMTENAFVTSNLGVGTTLADEKLHVAGNIRIGGARGVDDDTDYFMRSTGQVTIHANDTGVDNDFRALILKAGPLEANTSTIQISAGQTDAQHIIMKTKNTERLRINADGFIGVNNAFPVNRMTVGGNVHVTGSNVLILGNTFSQSNVSSQLYTDQTTGSSHFQHRLASGGSFNIATTSGASVTTRLTIKDTGRVGVGSTQPEGIFQTSGGSVFVNPQVVQRGTFTHNAPMAITSPVSTTTSPEHVLQLCRQGAGTNYGQRVDFKLLKYTSGANSRTRLDINMAHNAYDSVGVMTIRSDGRVGISTQSPSSKLEMVAEGARNPLTNGLLVHGIKTGSTAVDAISMMLTDKESGDAFSSYSINDPDIAPNYFGWTVGVDNSNDTQDFRITSNAFSVSNVESTSLYISGANSNVGIGTDQTPLYCTVAGDVRVGHFLAFQGLNFNQQSQEDLYNDATGRSFFHTFLEEREYTNTGKSELLIFKGAETGGTDGPDQIRHVAARHVFHTYPSDVNSTSTFDDYREDVDANGDTLVPVMTITDERRVMINMDYADEVNADNKTSLYVKGEIRVPELDAAESRISTTKMFMYSESTSQQNVIESISNYDTIVLAGGGDEAIRVASNAFVGLGTANPSTTVHCYTQETTNVDVLTIQSDMPSTGSKATGVRVWTENGYGGMIRGYSIKNSRAGLIFATANNSIESNVLTITNQNRVGVNTTAPDTGLHLYDAKPRFETSTGNSFVEFKTASSTGNIYLDTTGNIFVNPENALTNSMTVKGDLNVTSNISFGGSIQFGASAGLGIGIANPQTALHVVGGAILCDDNVASKFYSTSFELGTGSKTIMLNFAQGAFYAKIVAMLRETSNPNANNYVSTMTLEVQGGHSSGALSATPIQVGSKNIFGGAYPWSKTVTTSATQITIKPYYTQNQRIYQYDLSVQLMSARDGKLLSVQYDPNNPKTKWALATPY